MEDVTNLTVGHYGMVLVMPLFIGLAALSYFMTPKKWRKSIQEKTIIILFHICGCLALFGLTSWFCDLPDSWFKLFITVFQTFYLDFLIISTMILLLIKLINFIFKKITKGKYSSWNYRAIWLTCLCVIGVFTFVSIYHDETIQNTNYTVELNKPTPVKDMRIAMYSDSHMGAGANQTTFGYTTDRLNTMNPDILILDGDIVDGTTSEEDLHFLTSTLKNINPKYGKYFIMGNHDDNCLYDYEGALKDAGVTILRDEAVVLKNGSILVGKDDKTNIEPKEIMSNCNISEDTQNKSFVVVAQHRPERAELYKTQCDLMICGHTHGIHFPILNPLSRFLSDKNLYGERYYDNMCSITSSGLSSWGFHTKWPSYSEIVQVDTARPVTSDPWV